jgi:hypothetical protein
MTAAPTSRILVAGRLIAIAGGIVAAAGTLLPWRNNVNGLETSGISIGFDADVFLLLSILTVVASVAAMLRGRISDRAPDLIERYVGTGAALATLGGGYVVCFSLLNIKDTPIAETTGIGLYLDLIGGLVMIVGGVIAMLRGRV